MRLSELQNYAEQKGISVVYWKIENSKGCVLRLKRKYHILLNNRVITSEREERLVLAHELGHCKSDNLYYLSDFYNPFYKQNILKAERRAADESCRLLASIEDVKTALKENDSEYDAAESLDVDVLTFRNIIDYYKRKGLL